MYGPAEVRFREAARELAMVRTPAARAASASYGVSPSAIASSALIAIRSNAST
jgi:hypothetical protein